MTERRAMTSMDRARRAMQRAGKPYADQATLRAIADEIEETVREAVERAVKAERRAGAVRKSPPEPDGTTA